MPYLKNRYIVAILTVCLASSVLAQSFDQGGAQWTSLEQLGQPRFNVQLVERLVEDTGLCRLDVKIEVVNDFLQFVRTDSGLFEAGVVISLSVEVKGGGEVQRLETTSTKQIADYSDTNSRRDFLTGFFTIEQPPGEYTISVILVDKESNRREKASKEVILKGLPADRLALSDLMLIRSNEIISGTRTPKVFNPADYIDDESGDVFLFFDLRRPETISPCDVLMRVYDENNILISQDSISVIGGAGLSAYSIPLPTRDLNFGKYRVDLLCSQESSKAFKTKRFDVNSSGLPRTIQDLDLSIKQLKYVATENEIETLKEQFSSERERAFLAFWNEKFPVDSEKVNGKMVEYYSRINYANENFSGSIPGWETDRGRILVIYGKPTEIERNVFEQNDVPYEIWYYNHLNKRFTFRDDYGFGDFRLVTPEW